MLSGGNGQNEAGRAQAETFTEHIAELWWGAFARGLCGIYRIGSLAHGGFNARYSDIDMAVIADEALTPPELDRMRAVAVETSSGLAAKLSIFWADRRFGAGRFPPLDRVDYLDHAVAVVERERIRPERPTLPEIRHYLRGAPFERWTEQVRHYSSLPALGPGDHKPFLRCLLYPARLIYSWTTGAMASNDAAVEFVERHPLPGLDTGLIRRALACRQQINDADSLFPERSTLAHQHAVCLRLVGSG